VAGWADREEQVTTSTDHSTRPGLAGPGHVEREMAQAERGGLLLAFQMRIVMLTLVAIWLMLSPGPNRLWALSIIAILVVNGWAQLRLSRSRLARPLVNYVTVAVDAVVVTAALVVPDPLSVGLAELPIATRFRGQGFEFVFVFIGLTALSYAPGLVVWYAAVVAAATLAALAIVTADPQITASLGFGEDPLEFQYKAFYDPSFIGLSQWFGRLLALVLVAGLIAAAVERSRELVLRQVRAEQARASLARYFSPNIVDEIADTEDATATRRQDVAVLFTDIRGFTPWSADKDPERVIALLRGFHGRMGDEIFAHDGTIDKYIGDAVMATFGTPRATGQDARHALACARGMVHAMVDWNAKRAERGDQALWGGIGLHFGPVVVGDVGDARRLEYTVIGDTVNVASRLEGLTREFDTDIVVSAALIERARREGAGDDEIAGFEAAGEATVKGRLEPVSILTYRRGEPGLTSLSRHQEFGAAPQPG
jgi:adenylate cyclase